MILQTVKQIIIIHILPNIWRSKDSKAKKYGQFKEYNMKNNFLQKSYKQCGEEANSRPFYKNSKLSISLDRQLLCSYIVIQLNVIQFVFVLQVEVYHSVLKPVKSSDDYLLWPCIKLEQKALPRKSLMENSFFCAVFVFYLMCFCNRNSFLKNTNFFKVFQINVTDMLESYQHVLDNVDH